MNSHRGLTATESPRGLTKNHHLFRPGYFTLFPDVITGGPHGVAVPFIISEYCTIEYAVWYNPDEDVEAVKEEIETYVGHAAAQDEWLRDHPPEVEWKLHWPPLNIPKDHPICRTVSTAHERAARGTRFEGPATLRGLHGVDDATFLGANGIPA